MRVGIGVLLWVLLVGVPMTSARAESGAATYQYAIRWYIADLKPSFQPSEYWTPATALTEGNYRAVLDGLKNRVGVNGIRMPIFPGETNPTAYPQVYRDVYKYARTLGLVIYASPLSVGMAKYAGWSDAQYGQWIADYVNDFHPDFVSPFNEAGIETARVLSIMSQLGARLSSRQTRMVGPDAEHVSYALGKLTKDRRLLGAFDVISSHNASRDASATAGNWEEIIRMAGSRKPVWSSENPREWEASDGAPGIAEAANGGVQGLVIWMAKPALVDDAGVPTPKALDIAAHLLGHARATRP